jgi:peptidoglycan hydrolase-like protein with peptidoglycan-binding domain
MALMTAAWGLGFCAPSGRAETATTAKKKTTPAVRHSSTTSHATSHKSAKHYSHTASSKSRQQTTAAKRASSRKRRKKHSARLKRTGSKYRLAHLHLAPERAEEIQTALVKAGYLKETPNGVWDDATEKAMKDYQADHHFPTTGLPESKTLMSLGLGPHPLPEDLAGTAPGAAPVPPAAGDSAPTSAASQTRDAADSGLGRSNPP